jgi:hypothetical protein
MSQLLLDNTRQTLCLKDKLITHHVPEHFPDTQHYKAQDIARLMEYHLTKCLSRN